MVYTKLTNSVHARGLGVFILFLVVVLLMSGAYQVSDALFVSGKQKLLATSHEGYSGATSSTSEDAYNTIHEETKPPEEEQSYEEVIETTSTTLNSNAVDDVETDSGYSTSTTTEESVLEETEETHSEIVHEEPDEVAEVVVTTQEVREETTHRVETETTHDENVIVEEEIKTETSLEEEYYAEADGSTDSEPEIQHDKELIDTHKEIDVIHIHQEKEETEKTDTEVVEDKKETDLQKAVEADEVEIDTTEDKPSEVADPVDDILNELSSWDVDEYKDIEFDENFYVEASQEKMLATRLSEIDVQYEKDDFEYLLGDDKEVADYFEALLDEIIEEEHLFEKRLEKELAQDTDKDGVSDYDEIVLYKTNPLESRTGGGSMTDGERILLGLDPQKADETLLPYENPKLDVNAVTVEEFDVEEVVAKTKTNPETLIEEIDTITFSGKALPSSFVTLYIFSTPIIVTVKSDEEGRWTYELDKELENGEHEMYVATVDNAGKIVARSRPIPFVKTANAATLGEFQPANIENTTFLRTNFLLVMIAIAIAGVLIMILFVSFGMKKEETVQVVDNV